MSGPLAMLLGMAVGGSNEQAPSGFDEGNGVVLYRWRDYEVVRVMTIEQTEKIVTNSFKVHFFPKKSLYRTALREGVIFALQDRRKSVDPSFDVVSIVMIEDFSIAQRDLLEDWMRGPHIPKTGLDRFSVWSITNRRRGRIQQGNMTALTPWERELFSTFLFSWLDLDPQWMRAYPRLYFDVPYAIAQLGGPSSHEPFQMPGGDDNYEVNKNRNLNKWLQRLSTIWLGGPTGQLASFMSFPEHNTVKLANRFAEVVLRWKIGNQLDAETGAPVTHWESLQTVDPNQLRLFWEAQGAAAHRYDRGGRPVRSRWHSDPLDAITEIDLLVSEDELDAWLQAHFVPGEPMIPAEAMEAYRLLEEPSPPLQDLESFRAFMQALR